MLYLALSCLQGRPMAEAFDELARFTTAIQLTPGNLPTAAFDAHVRASGIATRTHHGFAWNARKTDVWSGDGACLVASESVHPPELGTEHVAGWEVWIERALADDRAAPVVEVMYPGYALGTGDEVELAMDRQWPLVVDVSHVFIQLTQGAMSGATWRRLADYERITEVHVSANRGRHDTHQPLGSSGDDRTFGLPWVRERLADGVPTVLECYMHRLTDAQRYEQIEIVGRHA